MATAFKLQPDDCGYDVEKSWSGLRRRGPEPVWHLYCGKDFGGTFYDEATAHSCGSIWAETGVPPCHQGKSYGLPVGGEA